MAGYGHWRRRVGYLAATMLLAALALGCASGGGGGGGTDFLPGVTGSRTYRITEFAGAGFDNATIDLVVLDLEPTARATTIAQVGARLTSSDGQFADTEVGVGGVDTNRIIGSATTTGGVVFRVTIDLSGGAESCRLTLNNTTLGTGFGIGTSVAAGGDGGGGGGSGDPALQPRLKLSTTALELPAGTASGTVDISNSGTGELSWSATTAAAFLSLDPASGEGEKTVTITADRTGLESGTHTGQVTIDSNGGRLTVVVTVIVP